MVYINQDLTEPGKYLFPDLMQKFLVFTDRKGKTSLETMLKRWYTALRRNTAIKRRDKENDLCLKNFMRCTSPRSRKWSL